MKQIDECLALQKQIFEYFGYVENWVVIPIDDSREHYWKIVGGEGHGGAVMFAEEVETLHSDGDYYEDEIYTQRFLPKWVYRGEEYTMICCDTRVDGNKFLRIFTNAKEQT